VFAEEQKGRAHENWIEPRAAAHRQANHSGNRHVDARHRGDIVSACHRYAVQVGLGIHHGIQQPCDARQVALLARIAVTAAASKLFQIGSRMIIYGRQDLGRCSSNSPRCTS
jgi:hypothetical protein